MKKRFNVDSPSFTPATLPTSGTNGIPKLPGLSPRTANAAPFRPKNLTPGMAFKVSTSRKEVAELKCSTEQCSFLNYVVLFDEDVQSECARLPYARRARVPPQQL